MNILDPTEQLFLMLESENLKIRRKIPGDGNCFFRSVADQMERLQAKDMSHGELRHLAVTHLKLQPEVRLYGTTYQNKYKYK